MGITSNCISSHFSFPVHVIKPSIYCYVRGFPGGSDEKESACNAGDQRLTPGSGRSPGGGHGNLLQCSCLENCMVRGAWQAIQSMGSNMINTHFVIATVMPSHIYYVVILKVL